MPEPGVDRISLMRHWLVFPGPEISQAAEIVTDERDAQAATGAGYRVEGPFVPEPPPGAVDERDSALRSLESANQTIEWLAEQNERFRAELNLPAGGQ